MIKKIFKGIINGEEFDSVEAYNAKVDELVKSGKDFSASTETTLKFKEDTQLDIPKTAPVESKCSDCPCTDEHTCEACDNEEVNPTIDNIKKILDDLNGERENDEEVLCDIIDRGEDTLADLKNVLIFLNKEKLLDLMFGLKGEWDAIERLMKENEQCRQNFTEKDKDLHEDIAAYDNIYQRQKKDYESEIEKLDRMIKDCEKDIKEIEEEKQEYIDKKCDLMSHIEDINLLYRDGMFNYGKQVGDNNKNIAVTNSAKSIFDYLKGLYNNLMTTVQEKLKESDETVC